MNNLKRMLIGLFLAVAIGCSAQQQKIDFERTYNYCKITTYQGEYKLGDIEEDGTVTFGYKNDSIKTVVILKQGELAGVHAYVVKHEITEDSKGLLISMLYSYLETTETDANGEIVFVKAIVFYLEDRGVGLRVDGDPRTWEFDIASKCITESDLPIYRTHQSN